MRVKLLLFTFYLNGGLHAVSVGKLSERMSNFWTVWFLKTKSKLNFGFLHIPTLYRKYWQWVGVQGVLKVSTFDVAFCSELDIADRRQKREIRHLEQELPKWQVLVDSVTGQRLISVIICIIIYSWQTCAYMAFRVKTIDVTYCFTLCGVSYLVFLCKLCWGRIGVVSDQRLWINDIRHSDQCDNGSLSVSVIDIRQLQCLWSSVD